MAERYVIGIEEAQRVVAPTPLVDVLEVLRRDGIIERWAMGAELLELVSPRKLELMVEGVCGERWGALDGTPDADWQGQGRRVLR